MGTIRITNLLLRTIIGFKEWERKKKQDILVNIEFEYDSMEAEKTDDASTAVDYKEICKRIIDEVEKTDFFLLERLVDMICSMIMEDERVLSTTVSIDKPHALRYAESVSFEKTLTRQE